MLDIKYDLEAIAQNNLMDLLKKGIQEHRITKDTRDLLGRGLVHQCGIFGNLEMLQYLVKEWGLECLVIQDAFQCNLSHFATRNGDLKFLEYLTSINQAHLFNVRDCRFRASSTELAFVMKHSKCLDFLLHYSTKEVLESVLLHASQEGDFPLVKRLVESGADLECRMFDTGATPLDRACYGGDVLNVIHYLIAQGALVNQTRPCGTTPLYVASERGNAEIVKILLNNGAEPNKSRTDDGSSPLFIACESGFHPVAKLLLENGANINMTCYDGMDPLFIAVQEEHKECVKLLLKYGADINSLGSLGFTPLIYCLQLKLVDMVSFLIEQGADINKPGTEMTPLITAVDQGSLRFVKMLLQAGANPSLESPDGFFDPLASACEMRYKEISRVLLEHGATIKTGDIDHFEIICENDDEEMAELLYNYLPEENKCTFDLENQLNRAIDQLQYKMVQFWLEKGANPKNSQQERFIKDLLTQYRKQFSNKD